MAKVICRAIDCIFWDSGRCSSDKITYDPEEGCLTYELIDDMIDVDELDVDDDDDDLDLLDDDEDEDLDYDYDDGLEADGDDDDW